MQTTLVAVCVQRVFIERICGGSKYAVRRVHASDSVIILDNDEYSACFWLFALEHSVEKTAMAIITRDVFVSYYVHDTVRELTDIKQYLDT